MSKALLFAGKKSECNFEFFDGAKTQYSENILQFCKTSCFIYMLDLSRLFDDLLKEATELDLEYCEEKNDVRNRQWHMLIDERKSIFQVTAIINNKKIIIRDFEKKTSFDNDIYENFEILKNAHDISPKGMTLTQDTFLEYKNNMPFPFRTLFPEVDRHIHQCLRKSYNGGLMWIKDSIREKEITDTVKVFDFVAKYASIMTECPLPYGEPYYFEGDWTASCEFKIAIMEVEFCAELKEDGIPFLLNGDFFEKEKIIDTKGKIFTKWLTNIDVELLFENYYVYEYTCLRGYAFKSSSQMFKEYVTKNFKRREEAESVNLKKYFKRKLNFLYGAFATPTHYINYYPVLIQRDDIFDYDKLVFCKTKVVETAPRYVAMSSFISAYGRRDIINVIRSDYKNALYCDTDSIHTLSDIPNKFKGEELGKMKIEHIFVKSAYIAPKVYFGIDKDGKYTRAMSGVNRQNCENITFENYKKFFSIGEDLE